MKKLIKWFGVFAVIGTAIGLVTAYFCKNNSKNADADDSDFTEDEDLKPASGREYVSLKKTSEESQVKESEEPQDEKSDHTENTEEK